MSTINREELIELAADELNVSAIGQTLSPEDHAKIDGKIDGLLSNLASRGVIYLASADDIPDQCAEALGILLADQCARTFGKPRDISLREKMEEELRVISRRMPATRDTLAVDAALRPQASYTYTRWLRGT